MRKFLYELPEWVRWPITVVSAFASFYCGFKAEDAQPNGWLIILCVLFAFISGVFIVVANSETNEYDK
jgi:hypothetical protein